MKAIHLFPARALLAAGLALFMACGGGSEVTAPPGGGTSGGGTSGGTTGGGNTGGGGTGGGGSQNPATTLSLNLSQSSVTAWSGSVTVKVSSNSSWSAKIGGGSWASINGTASGSGDGSLTVDYGFNEGEARSAEITVTAGSVEKTVSLTQGALSSVVNKTSVSLSGTVPATVKLTATGDWSASAADSWLSVSPSSGGSGSKELKIAATEEFIDVGSRSSKVKVSQGTDSFEIDVTQGQTNVIIASENEVEVPAVGGNVQIQTLSNVDYSVSTSASWLSHIETKALIEHTEIFVADPNNQEGGSARQATITFTSGDVSETVTVNQPWVDPFTAKTTPGLYGFYGRDITYLPGSDQYSRYYHDGTVDFTLLDHIGEQLVGVSGIPQNVSEGNGLTVTVLQNVNTSLPLRSDYSVTAIRLDGETLWLVGDGIKLIVKI